jgi:hypothetical protein
VVDGVVETMMIRRHRTIRTPTRTTSETTAALKAGDRVSGLVPSVERLRATLPGTGVIGTRTIKLGLAGEVAVAGGTTVREVQGHRQGHLGRQAIRLHGTRALDLARAHVDRS